MLNRDVFVAHLLGLGQGVVEDAADLRGIIQLRAAAARLRVDGLVEGIVEPRHIDAQLFHQVGHQVIVGEQRTLQQVDGLNGLALMALRYLLGLPDGFLRFDCELVDVHGLFSFLFFRRRGHQIFSQHEQPPLPVFLKTLIIKNLPRIFINFI